MALTPEATLWIIGGLITACWALLMWRLKRQDTTLDKLSDKMDTHVTEDRNAFESVRAEMNKNHVELLAILRRG